MTQDTKEALEFIRLQIDFARALAEDEEDELVKEYRRVELLLMRLLQVEAERDSYKRTFRDMAQRVARAEMKLKGEKT